ncbi:Hypothetical Protein FCC1311_006502 [Hondaea fermentalgiana]|uniref:Galactose-3-O-sulfotransferase 3 n=1 Tax=Hondaea fermentalgiana TaxID=2315210 RepID=A0A2R5G088_9STRA|nr:Hypothetical Protein FCC1311_006502 [Hondaea fermentalgiana]|eukprot:GBG24432.1 Hypothetical Protein FCC1311_006502 [Hondaea fermentalgiana]
MSLNANFPWSHAKLALLVATLVFLYMVASVPEIAPSTPGLYITLTEYEPEAASLPDEFDTEASFGVYDHDETEHRAEVEQFPLAEARITAPKPPPLFSNAKEGELREKSLEALLRIEDAEFTLFRDIKQPSGLVFLKLHKVGGTSVALALNNASRAYNLTEMPTYATVKKCQEEHPPYDVYFSHNTNGQWFDACMPGAAKVTLFREPVGRAVSAMTWATNRDYFQYYPDRACDYKAGDRKPDFKYGKFACHDDAFRHNYTLQSFLKRLKQRRDHPTPCGESCMSITRSKSNEPKQAIAALDKEYALYATTEHLDEFIVMLALRYGWSLDTMIYHKCKDQGTVKVSPRHLVGEHAWAVDRLRIMTSQEAKVYEHAAQKFTSFVEKAGPDFAALVKIFKERVRDFQANVKARMHGSLKWKRRFHVQLC